MESSFSAQVLRTLLSALEGTDSSTAFELPDGAVHDSECLFGATGSLGGLDQIRTSGARSFWFQSCSRIILSLLLCRATWVDKIAQLPRI